MKIIPETIKLSCLPVFLILLLIFISCTPKPSILEITDRDQQFFDELLTHTGENVRFFPSYDKTYLAVTIKEHPIHLLYGTVDHLLEIG